ncbi:hypothetical protein D3C71_1318180 [compost metagenome]
MAACNGQRAVARQFAHRVRRGFAAVKIEFIADDQVIEVNHQQGIFLFRRAHAIKQIFRAEHAFFFAAGGHKTNTVFRWDILHALCQFQHHAETCRIVINTLKR